MMGPLVTARARWIGMTRLPGAIRAAQTVLLRLLGSVVLAGVVAYHAAVPASAAPAGNDASEPESATTVPAFSHVFLVVMENKELEDVLGNPSAPYLNGLAAEYGLAGQFYAVAHPSLPNYLALLAGDTFGVTSNCTTCYQPAASLADQIEASGRTWKGYFESLPSACYGGDSPDGLYAQKHNPFYYFDAIRLNPDRCGRIVPLAQLQTDLASGRLPDLVWIGPDMRNSTHDASIATGDQRLSELLPSVLQSPAFLDGGLLVVTYDEGRTNAACCGRARGGGRIMTVVASPLGRRGFVSAVPHDQYSLLRTIEEAWGLGYLGRAGDPSTTSLAEFFDQAAPVR